MDYIEVIDTFGSDGYWKEIRKDLSLAADKMKFFSTIFKLKKGYYIKKYMDTTIKDSSKEIVYVGDFCVETDVDSKYCSEMNNKLIFNLFYRELEYTNTLYIDAKIRGVVYTKAVRIKKGQDLYTTKVKNNIIAILCELYNYYLLKRVTLDYVLTNITLIDMQSNKKTRDFDIEDKSSLFQIHDRDRGRTNCMICSRADTYNAESASDCTND
ncbi:hypothetical protein D3C76_1009680 [compost metagenome]